MIATLGLMEGLQMEKAWFLRFTLLLGLGTLDGGPFRQPIADVKCQAMTYASIRATEPVHLFTKVICCCFNRLN